MTAAAYIVAVRYTAERAVCDALAEAVAHWFTADDDSPDIGDAIQEMRRALDNYHAHRQANP